MVSDLPNNSSIQIKVSVIAPTSLGGIATTVSVFPPQGTQDIDIVNNKSIISIDFNISNIASNPSQNNISFMDNLPAGLSLAGRPSWVNNNGCTATFIGADGDVSVGVTNLTFPSGVANCSFSVAVSSTLEGIYLNNNENFSNKNNIDTSQASATLTVLQDMRNVDIAVIKEVFPVEAALCSEVVFEITIINLGTTEATMIAINESLPNGYLYLSYSATSGTYDTSSFLWNVDSLGQNEMETLTIRARVISSNNLLNTAFLDHVNEPDRDDSNNEYSAEVILNNCLIIPEGISPNHDGFNDFFVIPCIEHYPSSVIKIFNRLGVQVYENRNYKNDWDGKSNMGFTNTSKLLPVGTYYYILEIGSISNPIIGWVYLNY